MGNDTEKLLRECNAGIKMGVSSIDEVLPYVKSKSMKAILADNKDKHTKLGNETHLLLNELDISGKEPNPVAKSMSWLKTNMKLSMDRSDSTVADLMTDGCNMGVKSLSRYLNEYKDAACRAKSIATKLIDLESTLAKDLRSYL